MLAAAVSISRSEGGGGGLEMRSRGGKMSPGLFGRSLGLRVVVVGTGEVRERERSL